MSDIVQKDLDEINELLSEINQEESGEYNEIDIEDSIRHRPIWTGGGAARVRREVVHRGES